MNKKDREVFGHIVKEFVGLTVRVQFLENYVANQRSKDGHTHNWTLPDNSKPEKDYP